MQTEAQIDRNERLIQRAERLAIHTQNCQALTDAYVQLRGRSPRLLRSEIDALLRAVTMERELWEANFNPQEFLQRHSPTLRRQHLF